MQVRIVLSKELVKPNIIVSHEVSKGILTLRD